MLERPVIFIKVNNPLKIVPKVAIEVIYIY